MSYPAAWFKGVRNYQDLVREPVVDLSIESPAAALTSLREAVNEAPESYSDYLAEALECYQHHLYRASILLVWSAVMSHLYDAVGDHTGGLSAYETANKERYGESKGYRRIRRRDDFHYQRDRTFIELAEKAGLYNRSTRKLLTDRLDLRNMCGHPTGYTVGREETVIFIESLTQNVLSGKLLNWGE